MKKNQMLIKLSLCLTALLLLLTAGPAVNKAMAYFTTYAAADGTVPVRVGEVKVDIEEEVRDLVKHVRITNTGDYPCHIRVKALAGSGYGLTYGGAKRWSSRDDGYCYYDSVVAPQEKTEEITVTITLPAGAGVPEDGDSFNVVVAAECAPVFEIGGQQGPQWAAVNP